MATEVKRFTEAYATMTVAAYEPLILQWISLLGIRFICNGIANRLPKATAVEFDGRLPAALALGKRVRKPIPQRIQFHAEPRQVGVPVDIHGRAVDPDAVKKIDVPGYPNAVAIGQDGYLNGFTLTEPARSPGRDGPHLRDEGVATTHPATRVSSQAGSGLQGLKTIPITVAGSLGVAPPDFDFTRTRDALEHSLVTAAREWAREPDVRNLGSLMAASTSVSGVPLPAFGPAGLNVQEALSPIGIAHYYRQLYFHKEEGVGPIEQAFTIARSKTSR